VDSAETNRVPKAANPAASLRPAEIDETRAEAESFIESNWDEKDWLGAGPTYVAFPVAGTVRATPAIAGFRNIPECFWNPDNEWNAIAKRLIEHGVEPGIVFAPRTRHETQKVLGYIDKLRRYDIALRMHLVASLAWQLSLWFLGVVFSDDARYAERREELAKLRIQQIENSGGS
jgi:hypothetical protein